MAPRAASRLSTVAPAGQAARDLLRLRRLPGRGPDSRRPGRSLSPPLAASVDSGRAAKMGGRRYGPGGAPAAGAKALGGCGRGGAELDRRPLRAGAIYSLALINRARSCARWPTPRRGGCRCCALENGSPSTTDGAPAQDHAQLAALSRAEPPRDGLNVALCQHHPVWELPGEADPVRPLRLGGVMATHRRSWRTSSRLDSMARPPPRFTARAVDRRRILAAGHRIGWPPDLGPFTAMAPEPCAADLPVSFLHVSSGFPRRDRRAARGLGASSAGRIGSGSCSRPSRNAYNRTAEQVRRPVAARPGCRRDRADYRDLDAAESSRFTRRADAAVYPTRGEGFNLPALEAMAAGSPLIVTGHRLWPFDFVGPREARPVRWRLGAARAPRRRRRHPGPCSSSTTWPPALREMADPTSACSLVAVATRARRAALDAADPGRWTERLDAALARMLLRGGVGERPRDLVGLDLGRALRRRRRACASGCSTASVLTFAARRWWSGRAHAGGRPGRDRARLRPGRSGGPRLDRHASGAERVRRGGRRDPAPRMASASAGAVGVVPALVARGVLSVVVLHNAAKLAGGRRRRGRCGMAVVAALRRADRVLVHTLADLNRLVGLGVQGTNVVPLPHGAPAPRDRPPVRRPRGRLDASRWLGCCFFPPAWQGDRPADRGQFVVFRPDLAEVSTQARQCAPPADVSDAEIERCWRGRRRASGRRDRMAGPDFLSPEAILDLLGACDLDRPALRGPDDPRSGAVRLALSSLAPQQLSRP